MTPSEYQPSLMDRLGPDAIHKVRAAVLGAFAAVPAFLGFAAFGPGHGVVRLVVAVAAAIGAWVLAAVLTYAVGHGAGRGVLHFVQPSGSSTPYQPTFSEQEALAVRGQVDEALAGYERLIAASPGDAEVRIAAAELYARSRKDARRAEALYREARRLPGLAPVRDLWISNRLVDLYRGQLDDEGRAIVELRRIVERFPSSREAGFARDAIRRMKGTR